MSEISSDDDEGNKVCAKNINPGMFVSGWDDPDNDLGIEADKNPHASLEREILWAATENNYELVESILKKDPAVVNCADRDGYTPLHKACYNNNYELALLLLQYKADPNKKTEYQWTPLHSACKWNNSRMASLMLQYGSAINAKSEGDQTPVHITTTVSSCRDTLITLLMHPKLDPEIKNNSNETAYQIAKRTGFSSTLFEMVRPALIVETGLID